MFTRGTPLNDVHVRVGVVGKCVDRCSDVNGGRGGAFDMTVSSCMCEQTETAPSPRADTLAVATRKKRGHESTGYTLVVRVPVGRVPGPSISARNSRETPTPCEQTSR